MVIYVLGSSGMLGTYVSKYLKTNFEVVELTRKDVEVKLDNDFEFDKSLKKIGIKSNSILIRCSFDNTN